MSSSTEGARHRRLEKSSTSKQGEEQTTKQRTFTEEEAVSKASNQWIRHFVMALVLSLFTPGVVLFFLPSPFLPLEYPSWPSPPQFEGPLAVSDQLASADRLYHGQLGGPESLVFDGDIIYTGTMDGWVNRLHHGEVTKLVRFGQEPCGGIENENTCGRPLGMRLDKNGRLIVCDAYLGLFSVDVKTGEFVTLYAASTPVEGKPSKLLNDLDIGEEGRIYFTDSSTKWHRNQFVNIILEGERSGRLLMYDPKVQETVQLVGGLIFPNGVQLTPDQSGLLVSEPGRCRILRYNLKTRVLSVWSDGLPGVPDNIRYDETSGTYWVGIGFVRYHKFSFIDFVVERPWLRGILGKVVTVSNMPAFKNLFKILSKPEPQTLAVEFDQDGQVRSSLQDAKGRVVLAPSEVHVSNGVVHIGSYTDDFIARLDRKQTRRG